MDIKTIFLVLIAMTAAVAGWMLVQVIYQALWGRREKLQQRLATPQTQDVAAEYRPIVLSQSREELKNALLNRVLGRFNQTLVRACRRRRCGSSSSSWRCCRSASSRRRRS
jgi:hypothetical protein